MRAVDDPYIANAVHTFYVQRGMTILDAAGEVPWSATTVAQVVREYGWGRPASPGRRAAPALPKQPRPTGVHRQARTGKRRRGRR